MSKLFRTALCSLLVASSLPGLQALAAAPLKFKVDRLEFVAPTNLKALSVKGEAKDLAGTIQLDEKNPLKLALVDIEVPVQSLTTGMSLRDEHMRERIFKTSDGRLPSIHFTAQDISCTGNPEEMSCPVAGKLKLHGVEHAFVFPVTLKRTGKAAGRAVSEASLKLSDFGIERPSHLGVSVTDEVSIRLEASSL